ncbi:hypothetical protein SLA2020_090400 [Shorea laevis]
MALSLPLPLHTSVPRVILSGRMRPPSSRSCYASSQVRSMSAINLSDQAIARRSADYQPPIWSFEYIQSLKTEYAGEAYNMQYTAKNHGNYGLKKDNLYATALEFIILRQHGYNVPQEIFNGFIDESGNFKACLGEDYKGMLYLYEASFHSVEVQATHQEDLKHASRWWKRTGLGEKLGFIRDRLVENFLWSIGELYEPYYGYYRRMATQVNTLITTIDDIYDVYGTQDELVLFTEAVERWDINRIENLSDYMKLCFFQLHNSINQMAADIFREQGLDILPYSRKEWTDLCKSYLLEVKWYHSGYTPTLQEYLDNAAVSIGAPVILHYAYALASNQITREGLECFERDYPNVIHCSSLLLRLANDLGTSPDEMKRGDVPKSIQCYMNETGVSKEDAREYIQYLIDITWKKLNKEQLEISSSPLILIGTAMNLARMAQFMYLYGDGHSSQDQVTRNRILSLVVNPIS